jgi:hypothetical protein
MSDKTIVKVSTTPVVKVSDGQTIVKTIVTGTPVKAIVAQPFDANTLGGESGGYYLNFTNFVNVPNILDSAAIKALSLDSNEVLALIDSDFIDRVGIRNFRDSDDGGRVFGDLKVTGNIIPTRFQQQDLGSPTAKFRALYLAGRTIYVGGLAIGEDSATGGLNLSSIDSAGTIVAGTTKLIATDIDSSTIRDIVDSNYIQARIGGAGIPEPSDNLSGIGSQVVDTFSASEYRTTKYIIQLEHDSDSKYHSTEILLTHDGTQVYLTEYGIIRTDSSLGEFDATLSGGTISLSLTPSYTNTSFKAKRISVSA